MNNPKTKTSPKADTPKPMSKEARSAAPNEAPGEVPNIHSPIQKHKSEIRPIIIIFTLILAIIIFSILLASIRVSNNKDPLPTLSELTVSEDKSFYTAENLTEISARASLILTKSIFNPDQVINARIPYANLAELASIQEDDKTAIAFAYANSLEDATKNAHQATAAEAQIFLGTTASDAEIDRFITTHTVVNNYNVSKLASAYKRIFNADLDASKRLVINSYGNSFYEPSNKSLYLISTADLTTESKIYKSSITKNNQDIFVDFVFVNCDAVSNFIANTLTTTCVDGFTGTELTDLNSYLKSGLTYDTFQNYTKYRLTFESDGFGNYLYKTTEILETK